MNLKSIFKGIQNIAGVDEVGRGSLIGPVYASAVILKKNCDVKKLKDSKKLTKKEEIKRRIISEQNNTSNYFILYMVGMPRHSPPRPLSPRRV